METGWTTDWTIHQGRTTVHQYKTSGGGVLATIFHRHTAPRFRKKRWEFKVAGKDDYMKFPPAANNLERRKAYALAIARMGI